MSKIVIAGGGFAALWAGLVAARQAADANADLDIEMIAPEPYLVMRPRLYEKDPETLREPILPILETVGIDYVAGTVSAIDPDNRAVTVESGSASETRPYDKLIVATGSRLADIPISGLAQHSFNVDTYAAAVALDRHLQEVAEAKRPGQDSFVVIGGGFTGIELALELRDRIAAYDTALAESARIVLIEKADAVGPDLGANPRPVIEQALIDARIDLRLGADVEAVDTKGVTFEGGDRIDAATIISTAGLTAGPLADALPGEHDSMGRITVDDYLRVPAAPDVYAAGDVARARTDDNGQVALMSCQHALRTGSYAGHNAARDLLGLDLAPYRQPRYVTCLDLGRSGAVFTTGWDREVETTGAEAKERKTFINQTLIYPPTGTRDDILAVAEIERPPVR